MTRWGVTGGLVTLPLPLPLPLLVGPRPFPCPWSSSCLCVCPIHLCPVQHVLQPVGQPHGTLARAEGQVGVGGVMNPMER